MSVFPSLVRSDSMANALCISLREKRSRASKELSYFFSEPRIIDVNLNFHSFINSKS